MKEIFISIKEKYLIYIIYIIIILAWIGLIMAGRRMDIAYYEAEKQGWAAAMVQLLVGRGCHKRAKYKALYDALGGYVSVMFTVLGMIVTGWTNISNRMEHKVYGYKRKELVFGGSLYIGAFVAPLAMFYALIHKYGFMAYTTMILLYGQLIISIIHLARTYDHQFYYRRVIKKICKSLKRIKNMEDFSKYDKALDRIASSLNKDTDWNELYKMFLDVLTGLDDKDECLKIYKVTYSFASKVFAAGKECLPNWIIEYTRNVRDSGHMDDGKKRVYWVLLDCMYQNCSEKQINDYLECLYDEMVLDRNVNKPENYFRIVDIEDIFSMIALQTERWLQENESELKEFGDKLNRIFALGSRQYIGSGQCLLQNLINERDNVMRNYSSVYHQCYVRLVESYKRRSGQINIGSFIESVAYVAHICKNT